MLMRATFALLLAIALPMQVLGSTQSISSTQMTEGSLLGQIQSTAQLQRDFDAHSDLIAKATEDLGLSREDFLAVRRAIALGQARYVVVPRHLDGMAGQHNGRPFIDRNITIPAGIGGWEVDLPKPDGMVRVFVPNACGNISYLRTSKQFRVAAAHVVPPIDAAMVPPQTPAPATLATTAPEAIATTAPVALVPPATATAKSPHLGWLGALILPILVGLGGGGGSHSPGVSVAPTPIPIHTICPTVGIRIR
jgi:hypothetical protein